MKKYDYIIIGAGSAGCVIANRLSAVPSNSVLLIEAGGKDRHPHIHIPGAYPKLHKSNLNWNFETTPQKHIDNRVLYLPRGKVLGGSSSINALAYVRGNRKDYDTWAEMGNKGWDYKSVLPYFKRSENNEQASELDQELHGTDGELNVTFAKYHETPFAEAFIDACDANGISRNKDYNGISQFGSCKFQFTIKDGQRQSTAVAFLKPILKRPNLKVLNSTQVSKILIKNDEAYGVEIMSKGGSTQELECNKEVILSAGAYGSPQILKLSGLGAKEELTKQNIEIKKELNGVGKNLQDHLFYYIGAYAKEKIGVNQNIKIGNQIRDLFKYFMSKKGALTTSPLESVAFFNIDDINESPNFQFHFAPIQFGADIDAVDVYDITTYPTDYDGCSILPTLLHPESRGEVRLKNSDPFSAPIIDPNFLSAEKDVTDLIKGGRIALDVYSQEPLSKLISQVHNLNSNSSDQEILDHAKKSMETVYHPVGTCKMGNDENAVVNEKLQVHGIGKLRVADASIMPKIVTGNTNAACIMIGEKCADMILHQPSNS